MTNVTWFKNLEHEGIQIEFDAKPSEEIRTKLKKAGFRWSGVQKLWYAKGYNGYVQVVAEELAAYGGEVGEPLSIEEKVEHKLERADARTERYEAKAESAEKEGQALLDQAHKMADIIPFGQPILVGHYSEKADRRYRERIWNKTTKGYQTLDKAKYYEQRAETASKTEDRLFNTGTTLRRIEKLEASVRHFLKEEDDDITRWLLKYNPLSRKSLEWCENQLPALEKEIAYWRGKIEECGVKVWGPGDFKKGEKIRTRFGLAEVLKVNKKTVKVLFLNYPKESWEQSADFSKVPFDELGQKCKMEA